jgi:hypothetical protein
MEILEWPDMPWEGVPCACLTCGITVAFDRNDLKGVGRISPRRELGKWTVRQQCPLCGVMRKFVEVVGAHTLSP